MSINLPQPISNYFAADANAGDREAVARCFTEDAVVKDEGKKYAGRTAIRLWKEAASNKYAYTSTPFACEQRDGKTVVTSHVVGTFPGSPVDLRYAFELAGDKIGSLEIGV